MLRFENVAKSYRSVEALKNLSLEIPKGEIFGLLGPNGAGKSTLMHLASGLLTPDHGSVTVVGYGNPKEPAVRAQIGLAPQSLALYDRMTARENLEFFANMNGLAAESKQGRVDEVLELTGLMPYQERRVAHFSGGMARRLNLAASVLTEPELLLLDEPTVGVDPQSREGLFSIIEKLRSKGTTIVYCTHYLEEASRLCEKIGILDHGSLLAVGSQNELIRDHGGLSKVRATVNGSPIEEETKDPMAYLDQLRDGQNHPIEDLEITKPNLEHVFFRLTGRGLRDN